METETTLLLAADIGGRASNFRVQQFQKITVSPGSLTTGDERAEDMMKEARRLVQDAFDAHAVVTANPGNFTKAQVGESGFAGTKLKTLLAQYDRVLAGFSKVDSRAEELQVGETRALPGGGTITRNK